MIKPYNLPGKEKCWTTGWKFVHKRLLTIIDEEIYDWVSLRCITDEEYDRFIPDRKKRLKTNKCGKIRKTLNVEALKEDDDFIDHIQLLFMPKAIRSKAHVVNEFFDVYDLLISKEEYDPDLMAQNILIKVIKLGLDEAHDSGYSTVERLPSKDRKEMIKEIKECWTEAGYSMGEELTSAEDEVRRFEDLELYDELLYDCFGDADCDLLDLCSSEDELAQSPMAEYFGIDTNKYTKTIEKNGIKAEIKAAPYAKDMHLSFLSVQNDDKSANESVGRRIIHDD